MLNLEQLRRRCSDGEQFRYLFFWGHQPSKDGKITAALAKLPTATPAILEPASDRSLTPEQVARKAETAMRTLAEPQAARLP